MDFDISTSGLGKETSYNSDYDPTILFRIPRAENREKYGIDTTENFFVGFDVWNCYELSFLTAKGLPVSVLLKLVVPCESEFIVESKSLKLYLFSFNMKRFAPTVAQSMEEAQKLIQSDLEALLECEVTLSFLTNDDMEVPIFERHEHQSLLSMIPEEQLASISFTHFKEQPELLNGQPSTEVQQLLFSSDMLRSNCRVTNQPDWGELFVSIESNFRIDLNGILAYIVSFREENHFHEEVVEMIYKRLWDAFAPSRLMVAATYTRRGGIDINPIRASHRELLDVNLIEPNRRIKKSLRQ